MTRKSILDFSLEKMNDSSSWLLLAASVTLIVFATAQSCPPCVNERVCETDLTCVANQSKQDGLSVCKCCPGCVYVLGLGDPCSPTFSTRCGQGLECNATSLVCEKQRGCFAFENEIWMPACLPDGTYAPKQCKGERANGLCFCYGGDGTRIFGQQWWAKAENMTCECSRRVWELEKEGRTDVTLHCNDLGNYEPLQCDRGFCWCAAEKTGQPITPLVPESVMTRLPCYNKTTVGSQYLRQCESLLVAQSRIAQLMAKHGTTYDITDKIMCDPDGSYGNYQIDNIICFCSWKDRSRIESWAAAYVIDMVDVNCNCARDNKWYAEQGETLPQACQGNGNYEPKQKKGNNMYCVDSDGFPTTPPIPIPLPPLFECPS